MTLRRVNPHQLTITSWSNRALNQPCHQSLKSRHRRARAVISQHTYWDEWWGVGGELSQHICLPPIKMSAKAFNKGLLSRAPSNRYIFITETKGFVPFINRHLFQQMSRGDVGCSHFPICTHVWAVGGYSSGRPWAGGYGFSHITLERFWLHEKVGCGLPAKLNTNRFPSGPSLKTFCSVFSEIPFPGSLW